MRTTVTIQEPILDHARKEAARLGVTVSEVIELALRKYLVERSEPVSKPFTLHTVHGQLVNPDLDLDRTSTLVIEDDQKFYR
jgi:hypothetical protein